MTRLTVYPDDDATTILFETQNPEAVATMLEEINVKFERWLAGCDLADDAGPDEVLAAYREDVDRLMQEGGYQSVDVVRVKPDHPDRVAMRQKFLAEHTHDDDEIRFFVEGAGAFYLRTGGRVYQVICERNDMLHVPAGITHWFDTGVEPHFCAIRIFTTPDGWVGHFTGDDIATRFPAFEPAA
ncbi:MAG: cupin [Rhizobiales bacterium]|nr:cupin [Hyphomicrobiales bacterium]